MDRLDAQAIRAARRLAAIGIVVFALCWAIQRAAARVSSIVFLPLRRFRLPRARMRPTMSGRRSAARPVLLLGLAIAGLAFAPAAFGRGTIPKHFAYAAEARVTVVYDGDYQRDTVQLGVPCNNGDQSSARELDSREIYQLKRT